MDFGEDNSFWGYDEDGGGGGDNISLSRSLSFGDEESESNLTSEGTSSASGTSHPICPPSPKTPWTRSPARETRSSPHINHTRTQTQMQSQTPAIRYHCVASMHRNEGTIHSITISKDFIFTGSESSRIRAWRQPDCIEMGYIKASVGDIRSTLAHGKLLFTTHGDFKIRVWDVSLRENFQPKKTMTLPKKKSIIFYPRKNSHQHKDYITCIAFNQREKLLYTGSWDKTVKVWKITKKQCVDSFVAHEGHVNAIVISQEDGYVFTCSSDGSIKIWRRIFGESSHLLTMTLQFQPSPVNALALSLTATGCIMYSGSSDGLINFWEKERMSGRFNHGGFLQGHHFGVLCLVALEDLLLSGSEDATIRIWRREDGNTYHSCLAVIDGHHGPVKCLAASIETELTMISLLVYSASLDQTFKVWRVKVSPVAKITSYDQAEAKDPKMGFERTMMNPVLSPSWVEKKIHGSHFHY
ncbi:hypothetical protein LIER_31401 [Lithospermum erythrorhizon]|uniref:Uncharacterized protein n=1 Tax=Lithospermum erythrorhizon TaxID=34254 RepID=A0AAV3RRV7_LITER